MQTSIRGSWRDARNYNGNGPIRSIKGHERAQEGNIKRMHGGRAASPPSFLLHLRAQKASWILINNAWSMFLCFFSISPACRIKIELCTVTGIVDGKTSARPGYTLQGSGLLRPLSAGCV